MSAEPMFPASTPSTPSTPSAATSPVGPHLGERISAFVDEALADDSRDRALVHIAGCGQCRAEVDAARLLKTRLAVLPAPQVPAGLTARLLAMAEPGGPIPPRPGHLPGQPVQPRPVSVPARPAAGRPQGTRPAGRADRSGRDAGRDVSRDSTRRARRTVRFAALAGAALSTMVVAVVGISTGVGPETRSPGPLTQLTTNVGGAGGTSGVADPMLDVSRVVRRVTTSSVVAPTP